jgi:hypothetical protein
VVEAPGDLFLPARRDVAGAPVIAGSYLGLDLLHIEPLLGEALVGGGLMAILEVRPPDFPAMSLARRERVGDPIGKECRNIPS